MGGLLALLYWVVIPIVVIVVGAKVVLTVLSGTESIFKWAAIVFGCLLALFALVWVLGGGKKLSLDEEVKRLCATDGGTRVFEEVALPASEFDEYGTPKYWYSDRGKSTNRISDDSTTIERPMGSNHIWEWEVRHLKKGNPSMSRSQFKVIRRSDGKVMGESISYSRGGGDLPGPWHESSFRCPNDAPDLLKSVFVRQSAARANPSLQGTLRDEAAQRP
jgi:hypothetical protein